MRINNVEYPNVSIRVIESKRVVGLSRTSGLDSFEGRRPIAISVTVNARKQTA